MTLSPICCDLYVDNFSMAYFVRGTRNESSWGESVAHRDALHLWYLEIKGPLGKHDTQLKMSHSEVFGYFWTCILGSQTCFRSSESLILALSSYPASVQRFLLFCLSMHYRKSTESNLMLYVAGEKKSYLQQAELAIQYTAATWLKCF